MNPPDAGSSYRREPAVGYLTEDGDEYPITTDQIIGWLRCNTDRGGDLRIRPARGGRTSTECRHKSGNHHGSDSGHESLLADDSAKLDFPGRGDSRDALCARTILRGAYLQPGRFGRTKIPAPPRLGLVGQSTRSEAPKFRLLSRLKKRGVRIRHATVHGADPAGGIGERTAESKSPHSAEKCRRERFAQDAHHRGCGGFDHPLL